MLRSPDDFSVLKNPDFNYMRCHGHQLFPWHLSAVSAMAEPCWGRAGRSGTIQDGGKENGRTEEPLGTQPHVCCVEGAWQAPWQEQGQPVASPWWLWLFGPSSRAGRGGEGALLELIQPGRDQAPALFDPLGLKGKPAVTGMCPPLI